MKYEDFDVQSFNNLGDGTTVFRVTHKTSGEEKQSEVSSDVDSETVVIELMQDIRDKITEKKRPCSFAIALEAVVKDGKGMHLDNDKDNVVRAQFPDEYSMMGLPYLYMTSPDVGSYPWSVESCAPFATWVVID